MRAAQAVGLGALALTLTAVRPLAAQHIRVGAGFRGPHVAVRGYVGSRPWRPRYYGYGPRVIYRRPVAVDEYRPVPRAIFVRPFRAPGGVAWGWWAHHGFLQVTVWVDGDGNYYDQDYDGYGALQEVTVYERDGHYYLPNAAPDPDDADGD